MGPVKHTPIAADALLQRIDTVMRELQELRRMVVVQTQLPKSNLTHQLYGALGNGSWEEYAPILEWDRFEKPERQGREDE